MSAAALTLLAPLMKKLERSHAPMNVRRLEQTAMLAVDVYEHLRHRSGILMTEHIIEVLDILLPFEPDEDTVVACILHHVLDSREVTLTELQEKFGPKVRSLVTAVHLLSHITLESRRHSIDDLRLMFLSAAEDIRALLIILCDRVNAAENLERFSHADQRSIAVDLLHLFAPVAARLGIHSLKQRMEQCAFPVMYPADAERIAEQLHSVEEKYGEFLPRAAVALRAALQTEGISAEVFGREKLPYSIFVKMRTKAYSHVDRLHDLFALRVVVSSVEECYRTLGILHQLGKPAANRFKDFIAFPKPNGYQSLHTTLMRLPEVPEAVFIEVQIRTKEMHREAEYGIAAHWSYKEGGTAERAAHRVQLQNVLAEQYSVEGHERESALADHIYVLTPKGDIIELPEGATPLDFAFHIHTDLGLSFRAARVNGNIVPLDYELENGDVIDILKHKTPQPSPEWMQLLRTASSRSRLKRYLYSLNREALVAAGRELVNTELAKKRLPPLDPDLSLLRRYDGKVLPRSEREDLLMKIGQGSERAGALLFHLSALKEIPVAVEAPVRKPRVRLQRKDSLVELEGGVQMPMRFASCCKPQDAQGSPITGFITRAGHVMIHREICRMIRNANPERRVKVKWRT